MIHKTFQFSLLALLIVLLAPSVVPISRVNAATATITPSNAETYLSSSTSDTNYGDITILLVDPGTPFDPQVPEDYDLRRSLVSFSLSSIPAGSIINSARLQLRVSSIGWSDDPVGETLTTYQVTEDWGEMEATWNTRLTGTGWSGIAPPGAGGTWTVTGAASATIPSTPLPYWMNWTVTDIVKAWVENGQPNYGFIISSESSKRWTIGFDSREDTPASARPVLVVDYTPPFDFSVSAAGGLTVTPGGSGSVVVTVNLVSGSTEPVSLSVSGLPPGASGSFNPASGNPTFTSTLTITTSTSTPSGSYTITVTGTGSGTHTTTFTLTVGTPSIPVGGVLEPVNKLSVFTPYLALFGLLAVAVVVAKSWKKPQD